jgi:hypothetical protein
MTASYPAVTNPLTPGFVDNQHYPPVDHQRANDHHRNDHQYDQQHQRGNENVEM